jgi:uncharacterized protein YceK
MQGSAILAAEVYPSWRATSLIGKKLWMIKEERTMKHVVLLLSVALVIGLLSGCASGRYHKEALPDPQAFNAHFGGMDLDGNDLVNWTEFKDQFPQGDENMYLVALH